MTKPKTCMILPWPPRELHPNARVHWAVRAKAAKAYRSASGWAVLEQIGKDRARVAKLLKEARIPLKIVFHPKSKRRMDLDGCLSNIKSGLDGLADVLKVDDSRFELTISMGDPVKGGEVHITIGG